MGKEEKVCRQGKPVCYLLEGAGRWGGQSSWIALDFNEQPKWKLRENKAKDRNSLLVAINFITFFWCYCIISMHFFFKKKWHWSIRKKGGQRNAGWEVRWAAKGRDGGWEEGFNGKPVSNATIPHFKDMDGKLWQRKSLRKPGSWRAKANHRKLQIHFLRGSFWMQIWELAAAQWGYWI